MATNASRTIITMMGAMLLFPIARGIPFLATFTGSLPHTPLYRAFSVPQGRGMAFIAAVMPIAVGCAIAEEFHESEPFHGQQNGPRSS